MLGGRAFQVAHDIAAAASGRGGLAIAVDPASGSLIHKRKARLAEIRGGED